MPGELLYSATARFAHLSQVHADVASEQLFGRPMVRLSYDIPPNIRDLAEAIPGADPRELLLRHTLLPFYIALMTEPQREDVIERVLRNEQVIRNIVGPHSRVPRPTHLRFCPECEVQQRLRFGFAFWLRTHQLPTSLVCVEHGRPLLLSGASVSGERVPRYEVAGSWGRDRPPLLPALRGARLERFVLLAREGYRFLDWPGTAPPATDASLQRQAMDAGFAWAGSRGRKIDQQALSAAFRSREAEATRLWPWLAEERNGNLSWIRTHTENRPKNRTTFTHAVLSTFLHACSKWAILPPPSPDAAWQDVHIDPRLIEFGRTARAMSVEQLLGEAARAVTAIQAERPVLRATLSEVLRRSDVLRRALKIGAHDGLRQSLQAACESVGSFQLRRVTDIIRAADEAGETLTMTDIRQRSGIPDFELLHRLVRSCAGGPHAGAVGEQVWHLLAAKAAPV